MLSRSMVMTTADAPSMTRSISRSVMSLFLTDTMLWLLIPLMWLPEMAAYTDRISQPAMSSASSIAFFMESMVASMLTMTPLRKPREGWEPIPMTSIPSCVTSPTMAQIFVVPMSSPTIKFSFFAISVLNVMNYYCSPELLPPEEMLVVPFVWRSLFLACPSPIELVSRCDNGLTI
ncbi:MAG: hypothetical protein ACD_62C00475G0004 [uncultured bacterium]|nr:MAG: hypothetical protein ACD_62C00475G0004 [uncultured bacterium]